MGEYTHKKETVNLNLVSETCKVKKKNVFSFHEQRLFFHVTSNSHCHVTLAQSTGFSVVTPSLRGCLNVLHATSLNPFHVT